MPQPSDFDVDDERVELGRRSGDWGLRRMILHYAHLCAAAGGVDAFLIGSELRGLTQVRVAARRAIRRSASSSISPPTSGRSSGAGTEISYAADWSEYFGHHPQDGSGDVFFHLDPLWADDGRSTSSASTTTCRSPTGATGSIISTPRAPTRSPTSTTCAATSRAARASTGTTPAPPIARRRSARRSPTAPQASHGSSATRTCANWWSNPHRNRPGGVESGSPTAWVPESKPIRFTEIGCPAVDRGPNQPNVFYDPKSAESFLPYFSRGWRDDAIQRRFLEAVLGYWAEPANNPMSGVYSGRMIATAETAAWTWDARPYPAFPARERRLDRRRQLAARALAERPARLGLARRAGARALPPRRAARRPDRRLGARGRRARLPDLGARKPARLDRAARAAVRLRRDRERGR